MHVRVQPCIKGRRVMFASEVCRAQVLMQVNRSFGRADDKEGGSEALRALPAAPCVVLGHYRYM